MDQHQASPKKIKRDSELESLLSSQHIVDIEKMAVGGEGVARLQFKDKSVVIFVAMAAPNEKAKIEITAVEKNYLKAKIVELIAPSQDRRPPPCVFFENCGGCNWQHLNEKAQLIQKELILKDLLKKFVPHLSFQLEPSVQGSQVFHYRNRIQLKQFKDRLGYFQKSSHELVEIDSCLIAEEAISKEIASLKENLKSAAELTKYELKINQNNQFEYYKIGDRGEGLSFSQVNNEINSLLVHKTADLIQQINPSRMSELYSGSGNFTFTLLKKIPELQIESVELNSQLTAYAHQKRLAEKLQKRLTLFTSDCESFVARRALANDGVLLDPPRSGCDESVIKKIAHQNIKNIFYISCQPAALARDLKILSQVNPHYRIRHLQIFDMFPQTDHFETLVWLSKTDTELS